MKVEVSCFIGGMDIKEVVHVDKFEDAEKAAKSRNEFCRQVSRKVLMDQMKAEELCSITIDLIFDWVK